MSSAQAVQMADPNRVGSSQMSQVLWSLIPPPPGRAECAQGTQGSAGHLDG